MSEDRVRYAELRPQEFRGRLAARPVAYLPMGTLEWHGEQLPLGADGIISEGVMCECARRYGGIVMPPIHLGPDRALLQEDGGFLYGMDIFTHYANPDTGEKHTQSQRQRAGSCYWISDGQFLALIDTILTQVKRAGFEAVFADGHGPSRGSWVEHIEEREGRIGLRLLGVTKEVRERWTSQVDHAARNETSLVMAVRPDLVDVSALDADRSVWPEAVAGYDPRDATPEEGHQKLEAAVEIVGELLESVGV